MSCSCAFFPWLHCVFQRTLLILIAFHTFHWVFWKLLFSLQYVQLWQLFFSAHQFCIMYDNNLELLKYFRESSVLEYVYSRTFMFVNPRYMVATNVIFWFSGKQKFHLLFFIFFINIFPFEYPFLICLECEYYSKLCM